MRRGPERPRKVLPRPLQERKLNNRFVIRPRHHAAAVGCCAGKDGQVLPLCLAAAFAGGLFLILAGAISLGLLLCSPRVRRAAVVSADGAGQTDAITPRASASLPALVFGVATVGVMVENHIDARPQFGLDSAVMVYEAPAEGGISRYLAIFPSNRLPEKIGPVRSVRPYYIDWAEEWDATLFHSGGSPDALAELKRDHLPNLDEISYNGRYYWRDDARVRPHNLFTSGALITQALTDYHLPTTSDVVLWPSVAESPVSERPADYPVVRIATLDSDYCVGYRYEQADNRYERWLGGERHRTADGTQLYAKTVVVQGITGQVLDREGRLKLDTDSSGPAVVFTDGKTLPGHWERTNLRTVFSDESGDRIAVPAGPVWITVTLDFDAVQIFSPTTTVTVSEAFGCA
ncbi:MAG: DUF3048 domain-containing protein [Patescibacteria group bacterium]|nr:DUF3048 domain-containing protein [Patescibacteria group bacterium]